MRRAAAILGFVLLASSCGSRGDIVPTVKDVDANLARARAVAVPLYYAGRSFAGLPLTHVELEGPGRAFFVYGTCVIPAGQTEGGCAPPVQIQLFPFDPGQWRRAVACHRRRSLLGVPTARHDGLVLFTGRTVVKIYARSHAEDRRVALTLRRVGDDKPLRRLPPPTAPVRELQARVCR
ncbi:MAG: hypothetical protein M3R39_04830 [Actinomycetota bacterium]|nr:hypothetical protein [Actinomycetota bacterium]